MSMVARLGNVLLRFDEVHSRAADTSSPFSLSDLHLRILAKGKVKPPKQSKQGSGLRKGSLLSRGSVICRVMIAPRAHLRGSYRASVDYCMSGRASTTAPGEESSGGVSNAENTDVSQQSALKKQQSTLKNSSDSVYANCLSIRSMPIGDFLASPCPGPKMIMTSTAEGRFLAMMDVHGAERSQIQGLQIRNSELGSAGKLGLTEEQLSTRAVVRLAGNPPLRVGLMQRQTSQRLLRVYPLGLRFSGKNMSPLPGWLGGAQSVALNMSNLDLHLHLHFALFKHSAGYVLKPAEQRLGQNDDEMGHQDEDNYWPPLREQLLCTSLEVLSLHNLPKPGEGRPRFAGSRARCHTYVPELSGAAAIPADSEPSCPSVTVSLHPIGGFCAISTTLPLPTSNEIETTTNIINGNGMNAKFGKVIHCVAAEPHATFLRIGVSDARKEVAFETLVLGRLRQGYRVVQLRSLLGTRIELAFLLVRMRLRSETNVWPAPRQLRLNARIRNSIILSPEAHEAQRQQLVSQLQLRSSDVEPPIHCQSIELEETTSPR